MTTQTIERTDEAVDLSDLDLLDDPTRHIFCATCNGHGPRVGIALCGKKALQRGIPVQRGDDGLFSPDMCPDCAERFVRPCPRCSWEFR